MCGEGPQGFLQGRRPHRLPLRLSVVWRSEVRSVLISAESPGSRDSLQTPAPGTGLTQPSAVGASRKGGGASAACSCRFLQVPAASSKFLQVPAGLYVTCTVLWLLFGLGSAAESSFSLLLPACFSPSSAAVRPCCVRVLLM